ncbi:winged helix DNA-binding protein [Altererythrobacter indicus]|uniref:Winged helix DNA-binding protein n=1 Tax=Altericroceibacterium indicum TaxID=374177 RepID=A0A845A6R3_9SPHN|nr:winged helix DNA-binding protein [Altericroceibacterium indicum]MXP24475.1 winged helix DNA-binding protein [Altericroceibacterium indicum]
MLQTDFNYRQNNDLGEATLSVSVYANRAHIRDIMREDVESAGFFLCEATGTDALLADPDRILSDVILLDYPQCDAQGMAELCHFDMLAARKGSRIILSTTVDALDAVFGSFTQAEAQFLVNPSRADRVIALGQLLAEVPGARVRELSEEDRLALLRMTEQVNHIARKIDGLGRQDVSGNSDRISAFSFGKQDDTRPCHEGDRMFRSTRPPLPDPRLVRQIIRQRQLRGRFFDSDLFADPAWDILLDLTAARAEHSRVSVTSLCIASGVPPTTALRWISQMTEAELLQRVEDETDRRRAFIVLTDKAADAMAHYFHQVGKDVMQLL